MKTRSKLLTTLAIIICLAFVVAVVMGYSKWRGSERRDTQLPPATAAVSDSAIEVPKYEENSQTGERTIKLGSIECERLNVGFSNGVQKSHFIEAKSFRTNLTSGTAQQIADNVVVQYKQITDRATLKPIADNLAFLIGIKVKCMDFMTEHVIEANEVSYSAELLVQYPELQGPRPKEFIEIILGRGTGEQVLEQLAEMFGGKVMWSDDAALIVTGGVTAENLSMQKFVD
jgi:hypothetical protein